MLMFDHLLVLFMVALAIAALSITLTRARIFKPVRDSLAERNYLLFKLVSCPYCTSHWLAALLAPCTIFGLTEFWLVDYLLTVFILVGLSALLEGGMMNLLHMQEHYIQELEEELDSLRERTVR